MDVVPENIRLDDNFGVLVNFKENDIIEKQLMVDYFSGDLSNLENQNIV